jgi:hypothetical protein
MVLRVKRSQRQTKTYFPNRCFHGFAFRKIGSGLETVPCISITRRLSLVSTRSTRRVELFGSVIASASRVCVPDMCKTALALTPDRARESRRFANVQSLRNPLGIGDNLQMGISLSVLRHKFRCAFGPKWPDNRTIPLAVRFVSRCAGRAEDFS